MNWSELKTELLKLFYTYAPKLLLAIVLLIVGLWIVRLLGRGLVLMMRRRKWDPNLQPFLRTGFNIALKTLLFVTILGTVGVEMTSFVAILGSLGLAVGMALSGTLQNFAGGVMILLFKPFETKHYITGAGYTGLVKEIQVFNTIIVTPENHTIIVPNALLANGVVVNYSSRERRLAETHYLIDASIDKEIVKKALEDATLSDSRILRVPPPKAYLTGINGLPILTASGASNVQYQLPLQLTARSYMYSLEFWVLPEQYEDLIIEIHEHVKTSCEKAGIIL